MVELAWIWQRYQPDAAHVRWFRERAGPTGPPHAQGDGGGLGPQAAHCVMAVRRRRCCPGGRGDEAASLTNRRTTFARACRGLWLIGPRGRRRCPAWCFTAVYTEWRRPLGALPSRMRDSGRDQSPPDVRFAGRPAGTRALPWTTPTNEHRLTEKPSCEAGHMTASDPIKSLLNYLARRRPSTYAFCQK